MTFIFGEFRMIFYKCESYYRRFMTRINLKIWQNIKQSVSNHMAINNKSSKTNFEKVDMKIHSTIFIKKKKTCYKLKLQIYVNII